jgi:hypothetical protein
MPKKFTVIKIKYYTLKHLSRFVAKERKRESGATLTPERRHGILYAAIDKGIVVRPIMSIPRQE